MGVPPTRQKKKKPRFPDLPRWGGRPPTIRANPLQPREFPRQKVGVARKVPGLVWIKPRRPPWAPFPNSPEKAPGAPRPMPCGLNYLSPEKSAGARKFPLGGPPDPAGRLEATPTWRPPQTESCTRRVVDPRPRPENQVWSPSIPGPPSPPPKGEEPPPPPPGWFLKTTPPLCLRGFNPRENIIPSPWLPPVILAAARES